LFTVTNSKESLNQTIGNLKNKKLANFQLLENVKDPTFEKKIKFDQTLIQMELVISCS